jgi:hypothetical protein
MRVDKRKDIEARITYLQQQLQKVTLEDQRTVLASLLGAQQNTMMIIAADHRYASYVVEPPYTPKKPAWPNFLGVVGLIVFLTIVFWGIAILFFPEKWLDHFAHDRVLFPWRMRERPHFLKRSA